MTDEELKKTVEDYLSKRLGSTCHIEQFYSLSGGACQDNFLVDLKSKDGSEQGNYNLVLRTDQGASLLSSLSRPQEFIVARAAYDKGVQTPKPYWLERDRSVIGKPFYLMERIGGNANGRYLVKDKELNEVRKTLPQELAKSLAGIHKVRPEEADSELKEALGNAPQAKSTDYAIASVRVMRKSLDDLPEAHPALEFALNWLEENAAELEQPVLVHGDFRTGNFMVSPEGLHGIVDWEFAHWGDRHEDISWLCMRDWRFGKNNKPAGGFAGRKEFYEAYEKASGVKVDAEKVRYWEIMGNLRWAVGAVQQAERHLSGSDKGIELAAIGRRVGEMEYEILRLIEKGTD